MFGLIVPVVFAAPTTALVAIPVAPVVPLMTCVPFTRAEEEAPLMMVVVSSSPLPDVPPDRAGAAPRIAQVSVEVAWYTDRTWLFDPNTL